MDVVEALTALGGVATRAVLIAATSRAAVDSSLRAGAITRHARGRYALASADEALTIAHALSGTLCLTSAALHHGWAVKHVPPEPHVSVPRGRKVPATRRAGAQLHRHDLADDDIVGGATSKEATLLHCLRSLPFDEALCVADSAARAGELALLSRVARIARGAGAARIRRVVELASPDAANPFESCLRAIALEVPGLDVTPQVWITSISPAVRPDLVDRELRMVLEADSFEWHGRRDQLRRDARRYDQLVVDGWLVLRFSWEDVMFDPEFVRDVLVRAVALVVGRTKVSCQVCCAA
jgi:very-short-patch-repair endonuclease